MDNYRLFAQNLKHIRKTRSDHTQATMAEALGISERGYQRYEMGTAFPRPHLLKQIADLINISVAELIEGTSRDLTIAPMPQPASPKMGELEQFFMKVMAQAAQSTESPDIATLRAAKLELEAIKADPHFAAFQKATLHQKETLSDLVARGSGLGAQRLKVRMEVQKKARSKKAKERSSR